MAQEGYDYCESRTKVPFEPKYFSGLNWREAEPFIMRKVDASMYGEEWRSDVLLLGLNKDPYIHNKFKTEYGNFQYICTTPQTPAHPTITIGGVELPSPETEAPEIGTDYWIWKPGSVCRQRWQNYGSSQDWLNSGRVHLTEDRAQAWADFWQDIVINQLKG